MQVDGKLLTDYYGCSSYTDKSYHDTEHSTSRCSASTVECKAIKICVSKIRKAGKYTRVFLVYFLKYVKNITQH